MMPILSILKIPDPAVPGDKSRIFRGRWFRQEIDHPPMIYKKIFPTTQKLAVGRELTKSNLLRLFFGR